MVFKPFTHLARPILAKSFTHGYAQSVVAASQSSYASQTTQFPFGNHHPSRFGKAGAPQLQNAFSSSASPSSLHHKHSQSTSGSHADGGLAAYYAAWQQGHSGEGDAEWKQFQFAKRITWKAPSNVKDGKGKSKDDVEASPALPQPSQAPLERVRSASAADDIKKAEDRAAEADAVSRIDVEIAQEASKSTSPAAAEFASTTAQTEFRIEEALVAPTQSPALSIEASTLPVSPISEETSATSVSEGPSQSYLDHIDALHDGQRYAEIPAVFESMLLAGIKPTPTAYNALLAAAINLSSAKHLVVPKALDVYADMHRRKVSPDTATYSTLIELLASRALEVSALKDSLERTRLRFGGMEKAGKFMFLSHEADVDILAEDDSLGVALKLFDTAVAAKETRIFSGDSYRLLTTACAELGEVPDMIRVYAHMEVRKIVPSAAVFPPMISAFARAGDLSSAVECYNEYKSIAMAAVDGTATFNDRMDENVYAAVVKAYMTCDRPQGALKFFRKIQDSYKDIVVAREDGLLALENTIVPAALVAERLDQRLFADALRTVEDSNLSLDVRDAALAKTCMASADNGDVATANKAFEQISSASSRVPSATSMLALHVRGGEVASATAYWNVISAHDVRLSSSMIEPTAMYTVALIGSGRIEEGLAQARQMFGRIRSSASASGSSTDVTEQIDEGIEFIGRFLTGRGVVLSAQASVDLIWTMMENGGLVTPVVNQVLAGLGPASIAQLQANDLTLVLQIEAGTITNQQAEVDPASAARFTEMLRAVMVNGVSVDGRTQGLVEQGLHRMAAAGYPAGPPYLQQWQTYLHPVLEQTPTQLHVNPQVSSPVVAARSSHEDSFDPYGASTDYKGSMGIAEILEKAGGRGHGSRLDEALVKFRNMRRVGRHPRYITYAKLISAAAREERVNLAHDILAMARADVPLLPQYRMVTYGWASILDAMVGACLTTGKRSLATRYHQELLAMGAAPTANTFGLYITTLKETAKTFDEATEAVRIFHRAKSEGVEPSSFLYNALIGKLGKARRIDDCLFYFAEMRGLGIRPTSVTYGTVVNALCRVSDEKFAEELFDEMEAMPNYKPRPAPYNSLIQFFLTTKRDRSKVLAYFERMKSKKIQPTGHTYKLLIDAHATLDPVDMPAAEVVLESMRQAGQMPEAVHYASLIHARGCVMHDMEGARRVFDSVLADQTVRPQACLYQAVFEAMVANHRVDETEKVLEGMQARRVDMTPYIANTLIHGWAQAGNVTKSKAIFDDVGSAKREPSTYEAMARAFLTVEKRDDASNVVREMLSRGYPAAVSGKILELVNGGNMSEAAA